MREAIREMLQTAEYLPLRRRTPSPHGEQISPFGRPIYCRWHSKAEMGVRPDHPRCGDRSARGPRQPRRGPPHRRGARDSTVVHPAGRLRRCPVCWPTCAATRRWRSGSAHPSSRRSASLSRLCLQQALHRGELARAADAADVHAQLLETVFACIFLLDGDRHLSWRAGSAHPSWRSCRDENPCPAFLRGRAGAAGALITALLHARQTETLPQPVEQRGAGVGGGRRPSHR